MKEQLKEEAIRLTKDILDLPPDEYKPNQRAIMIVERLFALLSPKGGKPPVLSDENISEIWHYWEHAKSNDHSWHFR